MATLRNEGNDIYVSSGLENGDLVCLTNVGGAISGTPVEVTAEYSTYRPENAADVQIGEATTELIAAPVSGDDHKS